jgi:hypothetical protein
MLIGLVVVLVCFVGGVTNEVVYQIPMNGIRQESFKQLVAWVIRPGINGAQFCSVAGNSPAKCAPKTSDPTPGPNGTYQIVVRRQTTVWSAITVQIGEWLAVVINDAATFDGTSMMNCLDSVCVLSGNRFLWRADLNSTLDMSQTVRIAASWNFAGSVSGNSMKLAINNVFVDTSGFGDDKLSPPYFFQNLGPFGIYCRATCSMCINSIVVWNSTEPLNATPPTTTATVSAMQASPTTPPPSNMEPSSSNSTSTSTSNSTSTSGTSESTTAESTPLVSEAPTMVSSILSVDSTSPSDSTSTSTTSTNVPTTDLTVSFAAPLDASSGAISTGAIIGAAVGGSLGLLFVVIAIGALVWRFGKKNQPVSPGNSTTQFPDATHSTSTKQSAIQDQYQDINDVRQQ